MNTKSNIVTITIEITEDNVAHSLIVCGEKRSFAEVLEGLKICEAEIASQIANRSKCPMHKYSV